MTEFEEVLMSRDHMTREEAKEAKWNARREMMEIMESGGSYADVEDMLLGEYGLEMDYLFDILG